MTQSNGFVNLYLQVLNFKGTSAILYKSNISLEEINNDTCVSQHKKKFWNR